MRNDPVCPICSGRGFVSYWIVFKKICITCKASGRIRSKEAPLPAAVSEVAKIIHLDAHRPHAQGKGRDPPKAA
jgi:DnaJ-class molecular chaperone